MRNEYYGDRKDVLKWTVIFEQAAANHATRIVYVAMMRPDLQDGEGLDFGEAPEGAPHVIRFFDVEREAFGLMDHQITHPEFRIVERIAGLGGGPNPTIHYIGAGYRWNTAAVYFQQQVLPLLEGRPEEDQPIIILFDPDTGLPASIADPDRRIRPDDPKHKQLRPVLVQQVWNQMREGDVMVVAQWPWNQGTGLQRWDGPRGILAAVIGVPPQDVQLQAFGDVGFLVALK